MRNPEILTDFQEATLGMIETRTSDNPITGKEVANAIGLKQRDSGKDGADMRSVIHALRVKGYPICATGAGYWYPKDSIELKEYIASFQARVDKQQEAVEGMRNSFDKIGVSVAEVIEANTPQIWEVINPERRSDVKVIEVFGGEAVEKLLQKYPDAKRIR